MGIQDEMIEYISDGRDDIEMDGRVKDGDWEVEDDWGDPVD